MLWSIHVCLVVRSSSFVLLLGVRCSCTYFLFVMLQLWLNSCLRGYFFFFQAEDGIRVAHYGLEFRPVLFRSRRRPAPLRVRAPRPKANSAPRRSAPSIRPPRSPICPPRPRRSAR